MLQARLQKDKLCSTGKVPNETQEECSMQGTICTCVTYLHSEYNTLQIFPVLAGTLQHMYVLSWSSAALKDRNTREKNT